MPGLFLMVSATARSCRASCGALEHLAANPKLGVLKP
jgi:hypothetical protein